MQLKRFPSFIYDILIGAILCFPILFGPSSTLIGSPDVDVWNHSWGPWWWGQSLLEGILPWKTTLLHWPEGGTLWFIDPVMAFLCSPLALLHPALAYNVGIWLYVAFSSWAIRKFARSLGADSTTQWYASLAFAISGWMICEIHNGISEAVNIGPAALAFAWIEEACQADRHHKRKWTKAGAAIGFCFFASPYLGLGASFAALIRGITAVRYAWIGGISAGLIAMLPVWVFRMQLQATDAIIKRPEGMNEKLALHNAVDPRTFITPFGFQSRDLSDEGFYHTMYLGIFALFFALWGFRKHRLWFSAFCCCLLFSLGPYLYWGDAWLTWNGAKLRLPWWFLQQSVPGLAITHPLRLAIPCLAIVAAIAAAELAEWRWRKHHNWIFAAFLIDSLLVCGAPWPLTTAPGTFPAIYDMIKEDPRPVGVLDLPTDSGTTMGASRYLYWQAAHGKGIPYAPDVRASTSSLLRYSSFRELAAQCNRRSDENQVLGFRRHQRGYLDIRNLSPAKIGWIVLHEDLDPAATKRLKPLLVNALGNGTTVGSSTAWKLEN